MNTVARGMKLSVQVFTGIAVCVATADLGASECVSMARPQTWVCLNTGQGPCPTAFDVRLNGSFVEVRLNGQLVYSEYARRQ